MSILKEVKTQTKAVSTDDSDLRCTYAIVKHETNEYYCVKNMRFVSNDNAIELMNLEQATQIHNNLHVYDYEESKIVNLYL